MGVPRFFRWLGERYPLCCQQIEAGCVPEIDNLYLDVNGIIHNCAARTIDTPNRLDPHERELQIFAAVFEYILLLCETVRPRDVLFVAVDGVAPRAKINQQRARRFCHGRDLETMRLAIPDIFDSNCITPGTPFMRRLSCALSQFLRTCVSQNPAWRNMRVIFSGCETPGEGEHKILDHIRAIQQHQRRVVNIRGTAASAKEGLPLSPSLAASFYAEDIRFAPVRHCIYGLDADLIFLALATHEPYIVLLREEVNFGGSRDRKEILVQLLTNVLKSNNARGETLPQGSKKKDTFESILQRLRDISAPTTMHPPQRFNLLQIGLLRDYMALEFGSTVPCYQAVDDFVFMSFFIGNDFLPHIPFFEIQRGILEDMIEMYKAFRKKYPDLRINLAGSIDTNALLTFLPMLCQLEKKYYDWLPQQLRNQIMRRATLDSDIDSESEIGSDISALPSPPLEEVASTLESKSLKVGGMHNGIDKSQDGLDFDLADVEALPWQQVCKNVAPLYRFLLNTLILKLEEQEVDIKIQLCSNNDFQFIKSILLCANLQFCVDYSRKMVLINSDPQPSDVGVREEAVQKLEEILSQCTVQIPASESGSSGFAGNARVTHFVDDEVMNLSLNDISSKELDSTPFVSKENKSECPEKEKNGLEVNVLQGIKHEISETSTTNETEQYEETDGLPFQLFRKNYYKSKLGISVDSKRKEVSALVYAYLQGIQWILHYYYKGLRSWKWFYPYHYAPLLSDIASISPSALAGIENFELGTPYAPYEQLLAVLPTASSRLLPPKWASIMRDKSSSLSAFFPKSFVTDANGKRFAHEAVIVIPFIDENILKDAVSNISVDEIDIANNLFRAPVMCSHDPNADTRMESEMPEFLRTLEKAKCTEQEYRAALCSHSLKSIDTATRNDALGFGFRSFVGYPSLMNISHSGIPRLHNVKVFNTPSRRQTFVLTVPRRIEDPVKIGARLCGRIVWVNWPYYAPAFVSSVYSDTTLIKPGRNGTGPTSPNVVNIRVVKLNENEANFWRRQAHAVVNALSSTRGVVLPPNNFGIYLNAQILEGVDVTPDGRLITRFARAPKLFPYELVSDYNPWPADGVVAPPASIPPPFQVQQKAALAELFPYKSKVICLKRGKYYGCYAVVRETYSKARVVVVNIRIPPKREKQLRQLGVTVGAEHAKRAKVVTMAQCASRLQLSVELVSALASNLEFVKTQRRNSNSNSMWNYANRRKKGGAPHVVLSASELASMDVTNVEDIGLLLYDRKKQTKVNGFAEFIPLQNNKPTNDSKKAVTDVGEWALTERGFNILEAFCKKFASFVQMLNNAVQRKQMEPNGNGQRGKAASASGIGAQSSTPLVLAYDQVFKKNVDHEVRVTIVRSIGSWLLDNRPAYTNPAVEREIRFLPTDLISFLHSKTQEYYMLSVARPHESQSLYDEEEDDDDDDDVVGENEGNEVNSDTCWDSEEECDDFDSSKNSGAASSAIETAKAPKWRLRGMAPENLLLPGVSAMNYTFVHPEGSAAAEAAVAAGFASRTGDTADQWELGDRIVCINYSGLHPVGARGYVVGLSRKCVEMLFDKAYAFGGNQKGRCPLGHGACFARHDVVNISAHWRSVKKSKAAAPMKSTYPPAWSGPPVPLQSRYPSRRSGKKSDFVSHASKMY